MPQPFTPNPLHKFLSAVVLRFLVTDGIVSRELLTSPPQTESGTEWVIELSCAWVKV